MIEQIERLKKNLAQFGSLNTSDQCFFMDAEDENVLVLKPDGEWVKDDNLQQDLADKSGKKIIYRIHRNYTPAPAKPVFEGYVLCEVKMMDGLMFDYEGKWRHLSEAIDFGCCSYVFKEDLTIMFNSPVMFVNARGHFSERLLDGYKPATLKFVAFKEEQE